MIDPQLDHIVYAAPDLDDLVASFRDRTGIDPPFGGRHPGKGSRNHLVKLGDTAYLELIGPDDPSLPGRGTTAWGIDKLDAPRVVAWLIHPTDIDATIARARERGYEPGDVAPMSRDTPDGATLRWRLAKQPPDNKDGLVPALIDWQDSPHPATADLPEAPLVAFTGTHPDPAAVRADLAALDAHLDVSEGPVGLQVVIDTPKGRVTLS